MRRVKLICAIGLMMGGLTATGCDRNGGTVSPPPAASSPQTQATPPAQSPVVNASAPESPAPPPTGTAVQPVPAPSTNAPAPASLPPVTAPKKPDDPKVASFAGFTGPKPATWIWHPPQRQFSVAEFAVPGRDGHDQARIDVFKAGGSVEANIARWKTQFRKAEGGPVEPIVTEIVADGLPITLVEFAGEYKGMGMVNFAKDQLFLCAIVQTPGEMVFVRLIGPAGTVEPNRADFMTMIQNLKRIDPEK